MKVDAWAYQPPWRVDYRYTLGLVLCGFFSGLTPVLLFVALRGLIDDQLRTGGARVETWLALLLVVGIAEAIVSLAHKLFRNLLRERATVDVNEMILREALSRPVCFFERNQSINQLEKIKSVGAERLVELIGRNSQIIACLVQIATISLMLASIEPLILLVLPPCFLPYLWYQLRLSSNSAQELQARSQDRRRFSYFVSLLTSPHNHGFEIANCDRVAMLLTDDKLAANAIETCLPYTADIVSASRCGMDKTFTQKLWENKADPERYQKLKTIEQKASYIGHFMLFNRSKVLSIGGVDPEIGLTGADDYDMVWTLLEAGATVHLIPEVLYFLRDHDEVRLTMRDQEAQIADLKKILAKHGVTGEEAERLVEAKKKWYGVPGYVAKADPLWYIT